MDQHRDGEGRLWRTCPRCTYGWFEVGRAQVSEAVEDDLAPQVEICDNCAWNEGVVYSYMNLPPPEAWPLPLKTVIWEFTEATTSARERFDFGLGPDEEDWPDDD